MIKKFTFLLLTLCTLNLSANETQEKANEAASEVVEQAEKTFKKCFCNKKCKKSFAKLKKKFKEKKDEIIIQIADSQLSDAQKIGLVEAIESIENETVESLQD